MARADLILSLVAAGINGDTSRAKAVASALAAEERSKRHPVLAEQIDALIDTASTPQRSAFITPGMFAAPTAPPSSEPFREVHAKRRLSDIFLAEELVAPLRALIDEQHRADLLRSYNLEPRHKVLLVGPPGNGKTSCAEALAAELAVPLLVARYDQLITSFLGETAARLDHLFESVKRQHCVLFFDEFDVLAKERGDEHETGEIKRVVSSLLLQLDGLPSYVVAVAATNHPELLDSAAARRFDLVLPIGSPTPRERRAFVRQHGERLGLVFSFKSAEMIADGLDGASYSEIEDVCIDLRRKQVLEGFMGEPVQKSAIVSATQSWQERTKSRLPRDSSI